MVLFLTVPSTVGLALLGMPIIRLIFEHGRFSHDATIQTARALSGYAVGLVAYAAIKVVAPAFYALGRTRVPVIASVTAVAANLIWNFATFRRFGHVGLALGTSVAALANFGVLAFAFQRQIGGLLTRELLVPLMRIVAASAVMAAAVWALSRWLETTLPAGGAVMFAVKALIPITAGIAVYFGAARLLGLEEARVLVRRFRR
jgi:putative peptidoglycan lipid II flippase